MQSQIAKGKYTNIEEVIDSALKLLEKQDYEQWLDETRPKVQVGLEQLEKIVSDIKIIVP
ncbi:MULTISPECIES: type II toxin-antitoxin system ParD family antitoxin [unclassified Okeania]|uniref:ribbon-helix-helix domain-containing protein n=1 Tax=unclassified Okeania TaxID=2634635 RepID=UPI00338D3812